MYVEVVLPHLMDDGLAHHFLNLSVRVSLCIVLLRTGYLSFGRLLSRRLKDREKTGDKQSKESNSFNGSKA
jgi:hypothetical protein